MGRSDVAEQLIKAYRAARQRHNLEVEKNRYVPFQLINCVKFCGAFKLASRGHDKSVSSDNPGVFLGLVNFTAELDSILSKHLETAIVFKGTSKIIQNKM